MAVQRRQQILNISEDIASTGELRRRMKLDTAGNGFTLNLLSYACGRRVSRELRRMQPCSQSPGGGPAGVDLEDKPMNKHGVRRGLKVQAR